MDKAALRLQQRALLRSVDPVLCRQQDAAIRQRLLSLPEYQRAQSVFCFVSMPEEIDTLPFLQAVLDAGKTLCVPRCLPGGQMSLCQIHSLRQLRPGAFGILEPLEEAPRLPPAAVDFAVIPCLSATRSGLRLGRGGGYYDRFLLAYTGSAALVCREAMLLPELPVEAHDRSVPLIVTEAGRWEAGKMR